MSNALLAVCAMAGIASSAWALLRPAPAAELHPMDDELEVTSLAG